MKGLLPGRIHNLLLKSSEDPAKNLQNQLNTINDYKTFITEPLIEAISSFILIVIVSNIVSLDPQVEQIFFWLGFTLLMVIILSFGLIWFVIRLANQLLTLTKQNIENRS